jgi:hypothetical protein
MVGSKTRKIDPTAGTKAADKTKKAMVSNILEKVLLGVRIVKAFKV